MDPSTPKPNNTDGDDSQSNQDDQLFAPRFAQPEQHNPHAFPWEPNNTVQPNQSAPSSQQGQDAPSAPPLQGQTSVADQQSPNQSQSMQSQQRPLQQPYQPQTSLQQPPMEPQPWTPPTTAMPPASSPRPPVPPPGTLPQFGGPMAELPPLANESPNPEHQPHKTSRAQRNKMLFFGLLGLMGILLIVVVVALVLSISNSRKQEAAKKAAITPVTYNAAQIEALVKEKKLTTDQVKKLNKTSTFYTVFKKAATQPVVQTKWNIFYTAEERGERGDQHTLYDVAVDYRSKAYTYNEDSYSNIGTIQSRCIEGQQYTFNGSKLAPSAGWQPASDSTSCKLNIVATRMSDGVNSGGMNDKQADKFVKSINESQVLKVDQLSLVKEKDVPYLKIDVTVTPKKQTNNIYWGMQSFMGAFQSTGLSAEKHPYTYFGAANEGMKMSYYIDPSTQLPVYAKMYGTAGLNERGMEVKPESWSNRSIEYTFPKELVKPTLDDHNPITFTKWPDH